MNVKKIETKGLTIARFDALTRSDFSIEPLTFKNTVAGYLFAGSTFSLSPIPKKCKPERLERIEGKTLQFTNGSKAYFSDTGTEREAIFPVGSDGAAYGSIPFTECRNFHEVTGARVAIIDDTTGENPFGLEPAEAKRLVGDCYGKIDRSLHASIGGELNTPFQFRVGIKPDTSTPARIAKGTLSPDDLNALGVDLVMAKSSFKGRKGKANGEVEVGIHDWTTGIGIKTHAYRGEQALGAQILVNYPRSVEALIPPMKLRLNELREIATDPVRLATDYVDTVHRRYRNAIANREDFKASAAEEGLTEEELDERLEEAASAENEERFYRIVKADLEGHRQLLEHPAVVRKLNDHLRKQYVEVATGRFFKFEGALLQPSERLKDNEFCDPSLPDGARVLVTRSPFVNSNNLIELTNRHLEEVKHLEGVVFLNPETAAKALQADFDGDRVAFAAVPERVNRRAPRRERLRQEFLIALADEVREKQKTENRYADVIKKAKVPYTGTFPEIAVSARENQIGTISRAVMKTIAMENEIDYLPEPEREDYLKEAVAGLKVLAGKQNLFDKWLGDPELDPDYHAKMLAVTASLHRSLKTIAGFDKDKTRSTEEKLKVVKGFLHELVGVLGNELQVAVDGPKSALRPDKSILDTIAKLTDYRAILWLDDYKSPDLYLDKPMATGSYSPIDRMAAIVNGEWDSARLQPRKTQQFRPLFTDVPFTDEQKERMEKYRTERNALFSTAFRLKKDAEENPGPRAILTSPSGRAIEVVGIEASDHPNALDRQPKPIFIGRDDKRWDLPPAALRSRFVVLSPVPGKVDKAGQPLYLPLGYLSDASAKEHRETLDRLIDRGKNGRAELGTLRVEKLTPGIGKDEVSAAFDAVREFDTRTRESLPPEEIPALASALWSIVHARTSGKEESKDSDYRSATAAFALFSPEIQARLDTLQFKDLTVGEFLLHEHRYRRFAGESHPISVDFVADPNDPNHNSRVIRLDGKILGPLSDQSPHLPVGTTATATLHTPIGAGAIATLPDGATFKIGTLKNFAYPDTDFRGLEAPLTLDRLTRDKGKSPTVVAVLNGQILGEIKDKESKELLEGRGLLWVTSRVAVRLDRKSPSIVRLEVDPATVVYPDTQLHDRARSTPERGGELLPTLWCRSGDGLTLAVDRRNRANLADFLDRHHLPESPVKDATLEREAGYTVIRFESLPEPVYNKLLAKFGEPLDEEDYLRRVEEIVSPPSVETVPDTGKPDNPHLLVPDVPGESGINANRVKDRKMAGIARKFIGFPVNDNVFSSTRDYRNNWSRYGLANTGEYTAGDTVMVSGNGPWREVTEGDIRETFESRYVPELERAIAARANFVLGSAAGTDRLVADYLKERGYSLNDTGRGYYTASPRILEIAPPIGVTGVGEKNVPGAVPLPTAPTNGKVPPTEIAIYADGSCHGNPGPAGWAFLLQDGTTEREVSGSLGESTNNRAELSAAIEALKTVRESYPNAGKVVLHTDSQYLVKTMTEGWKRKTNHDLWNELDRLSADLAIDWQWVKGHAGHELQERVDRLANDAARGKTVDSVATADSETVAPRKTISPPARTITDGKKNTGAPAMPSFDARRLQDERTVTVAPILVDLLHCKLTTEYRGERYSVLLDPESQILSCYRAETRQLMMQARYEESEAGDERWKSLPVLLDDPGQPDIRPEDLDFLTRDLAPKLAALHERHSRIYADALAGLDDQEYLSPIERDSLIAVSLLEKGRTLEEVALTVNRSETFESLSPGAAIDYRRLILENAVELHREALEARPEDEIDR